MQRSGERVIHGISSGEEGCDNEAKRNSCAITEAARYG
jgi:hypothetical protein